MSHIFGIMIMKRRSDLSMPFSAAKCIPQMKENLGLVLEFEVRLHSVQ